MSKGKNILSALTFEELEMMELYILGMKNEQICRRINNSKYYILKKVKSVVKKLNAKNRIHAISIITNEIKKQDTKEKYKDIQYNISLKLNININFKFD